MSKSNTEALVHKCFFDVGMLIYFERELSAAKRFQIIARGARRFVRLEQAEKLKRLKTESFFHNTAQVERRAKSLTK